VSIADEIEFKLCSSPDLGSYVSTLLARGIYRYQGKRVEASPRSADEFGTERHFKSSEPVRAEMLKKLL
jgi:hypothetical protein